MNRIGIVTIVLMAIFSSSLWAQSPKQGWLIADSNLYKQPFTDADVMTNLSANGVVMIIRRKGGWYQVESANKISGWMRMNRLRFGAQSEDNGSGNIQGLRQTIKLFKTGRSGSSGVTVATGIRGLDSADIEKSEPDREALKRLLKYMSDRADSETFAAKAELQAQELAYIQIEKPKPEAAKAEKGYWDDDNE